MLVAIIHTNKGDIEFELYEKEAPNTVGYFCNLVNKGFYNGLIFHKFIPDTLIQTGCPNGNGMGHAGYLIKCELKGHRQEHDRGILSMAHVGRDTNGSQFFICLERENVKHLDRNHTCFGRLRPKGEDVLSKLRRFDEVRSITLHELSDSYDDIPEIDEFQKY